MGERKEQERLWALPAGARVPSRELPRVPMAAAGTLGEQFPGLQALRLPATWHGDAGRRKRQLL